MRFISQLVGFLLSWIFLFNLEVVAQDKKLADSLKNIFNQGHVSGDAKLNLLRDLAFNTIDDMDASLRYSNELITLSLEQKNYLYLYQGYSQKGQTYRQAGDLLKALDAFVKCSEAASQMEDKSNLGAAYLLMADVYSEMGNSANANNYYGQSITILRQTNDTLVLASALLNAGEDALKNNLYTKANACFNESGLLYKRLNYPTGIAYNYGNLGMLYAKQGKDAQAEEHIQKALIILEDQQDYYAIADYLTYMSDIYMRKQDYASALNYANRSLKLATDYKLKKQISITNLTMSNIYEKMGNPEASLKYYKAHIVYRDSLINVNNIQRMADMRTNFEVSQKQTELNLLEQKRKSQNFITICIALALLMVGSIAILWYRRYRFIRSVKQIIEEEKERSDQLLLNILPVETASELKTYGKVKAKKYENVSICFTDFKGFTTYSRDLLPEKLVETIDYYFSKFDAIVDQHGLEKIKTIGDAYMFAGGLFNHQSNQAENMIKAAIEILSIVEETKNDMAINDLTFDIRIGIHSGPVVAGVVGTKKFAFDIWGDTVNVASRMEAMSEPGKINISENTYELIKGRWNCDYRGEIDVKNWGKMKMYFLIP